MKGRAIAVALAVLAAARNGLSKVDRALWLAELHMSISDLDHRVRARARATANPNAPRAQA